MSIPVVESNRVGIMLIDAQPFFWDCMHGAREPVLLRIERLMMLGDWLRIPFIATFEHPVETKGWLPERLEKVFPSHGHCIFTSEHHARPALERMYRTGVIPCTLKTFFYELMRTVDKEALPVKWKARADSFAEYFQLESLPPFEPTT